MLSLGRAIQNRNSGPYYSHGSNDQVTTYVKEKKMIPCDKNAIKLYENNHLTMA